MKIAIIGAGNAGCAHACMLQERGHTVNLIKTSNALHDENFNRVIENGGIYYSGVSSDEKKFAPLNQITRDLEEGLKDVDVLMVMTQSLQHQDIAMRALPHMSGVKLLIVVPGYLGSLYFKSAVMDYGTIIAEGESTAFDARIVEPGTVKILFQNIRNKLGFFPNSKKEEGLEIAQSVIETYVGARSNIIESALHNPNLIVHTIGAIMSSSRIEYSKGEFWMYREAFTPSIWNLIEKLDTEKNRVIEFFDGIPSPYLDECKYRNEEDLSQNSFDVFNSYAEEGGPKGPDTVNSRYIYEDVPMGLGLLCSLSSLIGEKAETASALINIASGLLMQNFNEQARTIDDLLGKNTSATELKQMINK